MFWADSVCINQADIQERGQQVRLMKTIYRCAEIVAAWLGEAANDSEVAMEMAKEWKTGSMYWWKSMLNPETSH